MNKKITLYVNDPLGRRCEMNVRAAQKAQDDLGAELVIIKKGSDEYYSESYPPPCPSVAVNGKMIVEDGTVEYERLAEILKDA